MIHTQTLTSGKTNLNVEIVISMVWSFVRAILIFFWQFLHFHVVQLYDLQKLSQCRLTQPYSKLLLKITFSWFMVKNSFLIHQFWNVRSFTFLAYRQKFWKSQSWGMIKHFHPDYPINKKMSSLLWIFEFLIAWFYLPHSRQ